MRFRPERPLAAGGFGTVWLATQVALDRPVVVKVLHAEALGQADQVQRFNAEAHVASRLRHPNIVQVIDHGVDEAIPWIVYEFVEGASLRASIETGPVPWREACVVVVQIAAALEEAHAHAVLHRDVKPDNVLVAGPGHYKLTDFGIARWQGSGVATATDVILGSPAYISPGQIQGLAPGVESDVYALGTMFFELVTGRLPFWDENLLLLFQQRLTSDAPAPSSINPDVPEGIDAIVGKALARDRDARYRTARELREAVEQFLLPEPSPVQTTRPPAGPAPREGSGRVSRSRNDGGQTGMSRTRATSRPDRPGAIHAAGAAAAPAGASRWKHVVAALAVVAAVLGWAAVARRPEPPVPTMTPSITRSPEGGAVPGPTRHDVSQLVFARYITIVNGVHVNRKHRPFSQPEIEVLRRVASDLVDTARALRAAGHDSLAWIDLLWLVRQWGEWVSLGPSKLQPELRMCLNVMLTEAQEAGRGSLRAAPRHCPMSC